MSVVLRSCRGLQRILTATRQTECFVVPWRSPLQPLATWTDKIKRWSSGNQTNKESAGEVVCDTESRVKSSETNRLEGDKSTEQQQSPPSSEQHEQEERVEDDIELLLQEKDETIKQFQDKYLRALAEMENIRQRSKRQVEDAKLYGIQVFSKDILEVADILQKATHSVPESALKESGSQHLVSLYDGVKLTEAALQKVLKKNGVEHIDPLGLMFDPVFHEAMFEVDGDKPGTIAHVTTLGYTLHGRTIRPARVGVVKQPGS